jgi:hypothetical protein
MSNQLMIGVLLIAAGILLAMVAYWVISGGGSAKEPESVEEAKIGEEPEPAGTEAGDPDTLVSEDKDVSDEIPDLPDKVQTSAEQDDLETTDEIAPEELPTADLHSEAEEEAAVEKADKPDFQPQPGSHISIATLLRDELSGQLIVRVGDKEYHNPDDLRASSDWNRVEYAASDLQNWVSRDALDQPRVDREVEIVEPKPMSMIEQIDAILQEKIDSSGRSHLGVRLLESPSGAVRVLIGVQSYDLADVPDDDVRRLIQEAVAIWEADQ